MPVSVSQRAASVAVPGFVPGRGVECGLINLAFPPGRRGRETQAPAGAPTEVSVLPLWEGCRESRRCSRDTYLESYITKYTSIRRLAAV